MRRLHQLLSDSSLTLKLLLLCASCLCHIAAVTIPTPVTCPGRFDVIANSSQIVRLLATGYAPLSRCTMRIRASRSGQTIRVLRPESVLLTECLVDFLRITDGGPGCSNDSLSITAATTTIGLLSYDGGKADIGSSVPLIAYSGCMTIDFLASPRVQKNGFNIQLAVEDCPANCMGQGSCINGTCVCSPNFYGRLCQHPVLLCENHGVWNASRLACDCQPGYSGMQCSYMFSEISGDQTPSPWHPLQLDGRGLTPRFFHGAVFNMHQNTYYAFGGRTLDTCLADLVSYSFPGNAWITISPIASSSIPEPRYGHVMASVNDSVLIYGGLDFNDNVLGDLWLFNLTTKLWLEIPLPSPPAWRPRAVGLAASTVSADLGQWFIFGGRAYPAGEWSDELFVIDLSTVGSDKLSIRPLASISNDRESSLRLAREGHTMVHDPVTRCLLVFGGAPAPDHRVGYRRIGRRRYSSDLLAFHLETRVWARLGGSAGIQPTPVAYHAAARIGRYMAAFGGASNAAADGATHDGCLVSMMYFYHIDCSVWLEPKDIIRSPAPLAQSSIVNGAMGLTATAVNDNAIVFAGGFSGVLHADVQLYLVTANVARHRSALPKTAQQRCMAYGINELDCTADIDCAYCSTSVTGSSDCRSRHREPTVYNSTTATLPACQLKTSLACPGMCGGALSGPDCADGCLGVGSNAGCVWLPSKPSGHQCAHASDVGRVDRIVYNRSACPPDGRIYAAYLRPANASLLWPDDIIPLSSLQSVPFSYSWPQHPTIDTERQFENDTYSLRIAALVELYPLVAEPSNDSLIRSTIDGWRNGYRLPLVTANLGWNASRDSLKLLSTQSLAGIASRQFESTFFSFPAPAEPGRLRRLAYQLDFSWTGQADSASGFLLRLQLGRRLTEVYTDLNSSVLQPVTGPLVPGPDCASQSGCLACLLQRNCGWCQSTRSCQPLSMAAGDPVCDGNRSQARLPEHCPVCNTSYTNCADCLTDSGCEWHSGMAMCVRRGRFPPAVVASTSSGCPLMCEQLQSNCSACLATSGCVWAGASFVAGKGVGRCLPQGWVEQLDLLGSRAPWSDAAADARACRSCSERTICSDCLRGPDSCSWCYRPDKAQFGVCSAGGLEARCDPASNFTALAAFTCPPIDECALGLATDCHPNATCVDNPAGYDCVCNPGFAGNGRKCTRVCHPACPRGVPCSGPPDYRCLCPIGWTGPDCSQDCGCNGHANCSGGIGRCDACQDNTAGASCDACLAGFYRLQSLPVTDACQPCNCHGHGAPPELCSNVTGECRCLDNAAGPRCETCQPGYAGNPAAGQPCHSVCLPDKRRIVTLQASGNSSSLLIGQSGMFLGSCYALAQALPSTGLPSVSLLIRVSHNVPCLLGALHVYNGSDIDVSLSFRPSLLGRWCGTPSTASPAARSDLLVPSGTQVTIAYEANYAAANFTVLLAAIRCPDCGHGYVCSPATGQCRLPSDADSPTACPHNCSGFGVCHQGVCRCAADRTGPDCAHRLNPAIFGYETLSDVDRILSASEHPPRLYGHSLTRCGRHLYLFGGIDPQSGLSSGVSYQLWRADLPSSPDAPLRWVNLTDNHTVPGLYLHRAACYADDTLVIVGGRASPPLSGSGSYLFLINTTSMRTTVSMPLQCSPSQPQVVGFDMSMADPAPSSSLGYLFKLYIIGGVYLDPSFAWQPAETGLGPFVVTVYADRCTCFMSHSLSAQSPSGGPLAVFGHSVATWQRFVYTFGGLEHDGVKFSPSDRLYAYDIDQKKYYKFPITPGAVWPKPMAFHAMVSVGDYLLVHGGNVSFTGSNSGGGALGGFVYGEARNWLYSIRCNQWLPLATDTVLLQGSDTVNSSSWPTADAAHPLVYSAAAAVAATSNSTDGAFGYHYVYTYGGSVYGRANGRLGRLRVPLSACEATRGDGFWCLAFGCQMCSGQCRPPGYASEPAATASTCSDISACAGNSSRAPACEDLRSSCSTCTEKSLRNAPNHVTSTALINCAYCDGFCRQTASEAQPCLLNNAGNSTLAPIQCAKCPAATCQRCSQQSAECLYAASVGGYLACRQRNADERNLQVCAAQSNRSTCSRSTSGGCTVCTDNIGGFEPGSLGCSWLSAGSSGSCLPAAFVEPLCPDGACGIFNPKQSASSCPKLSSTDCANQTYCRACLAGCRGRGWCGVPITGVGRCLPGGFAKPSTTAGADCPALSLWRFDACPLEDECSNGHHNCDLARQVCVDLEDGFRCDCRPGYAWSNSSSCEPVCSPACNATQGRCTQPNVCTCLFGYTGPTCDVACECNGHSNCAGPSPVDRRKCLACQNNTKGPQCEHCMPLHAGVATAGEPCLPCRLACNGHSAVCLTESDRLLYESRPDAYPINGSDFSWISRGPSLNNETRCMLCDGNTEGSKCQQCRGGFYRLDFNRQLPCQRCHCNGHSDECSRDTGQGCDCKNNTRSACSDVTDQRCREMQCATCTDFYSGTPTDGRQCYHKMGVNNYFCLDYQHSQKACGVPNPPAYLPTGRTLFFQVSPVFLNVDVRLFVDIVRGSADLYLSASDRTFIVNNTVDSKGFWSNLVSIDQAAATAAAASNRRLRRRRDTAVLNRSPGVSVLEVQASPYLAYVAMSEPNSIIVIRNASSRVVVSIPYQSHKFSTEKFYLVVQGVSPDDNVSGTVFFRQDQNHINLLVFFSMFFSCFFLLFGMVVMAWKARQAHSRRLARQRRERERQTMAARPFGRVRLVVASSPEAESAGPGLVNPVCLEPLVNSAAGKSHHASALCTVLVQLPYPQAGAFCLGSALVLTRSMGPFLHGKPPAQQQQHQQHQQHHQQQSSIALPRVVIADSASAAEAAANAEALADDADADADAVVYAESFPSAMSSAAGTAAAASTSRRSEPGPLQATSTC